MCGRKFVLALLLVSLLVQSVPASSYKEELSQVIQSLKLDISLLKTQIENLEKKISDLQTIISDLEKSNEEMQKLSAEDKILLENSKKELEIAQTQLTESKEDLRRLNNLLASYSQKITNRNIVIIIESVLIAILGGLLYWT